MIDRLSSVYLFSATSSPPTLTQSSNLKNISYWRRANVFRCTNFYCRRIPSEHIFFCSTIFK